MNYKFNMNVTEPESLRGKSIETLCEVLDFPYPRCDRQQKPSLSPQNVFFEVKFLNLATSLL